MMDMPREAKCRSSKTWFKCSYNLSPGKTQVDSTPTKATTSGAGFMQALLRSINCCRLRCCLSDMPQRCAVCLRLPTAVQVD